MLNALLIFVIILLYTFQSFFCKKYTDHYPGAESNASPVFAIFSGLFVSLVAFCFSGFRTDFQPLTLILGLCNGATLFVYNIALIRASQTGPYSILMVFSLSGGIAIPTLVNFLVYRKTISVWAMLCLAAIFAAIYLVSKKENEQFINRRVFFLSSLLLMCANGGYGALLAIQNVETGEVDQMSMVAVTFLTEAVLATITLAIKEKKNFFPVMKQNGRSAMWLVLCSLVTASAILLLVTLIARMGEQIHILYTFDNAGTMLFSVLVSAIFLREKLSTVNKIGAALMCAALIGVSVL